MAEDPQSGCKVWKPNVLPTESVTWSGACTDGYASGSGIARWSSGGKELLTYEGTFKGGVVQYNLANGGIDYATTGGKIDDIKAKIDDFKKQIIAGTIKVPSKP